MNGKLQYGFGLGLRGPHYEYVLQTRPTTVDWFEIISENFMEMHEGYISMLQDLRQDYALTMHGVSLSIGSTDKLNYEYLRKLCKLADAINPAIISDHLCYTGVQAINTHELLPIPLTEDSLQHVADRCRQVQDIIGRRLFIENPSSYLQFAQSTIAENEFLLRLIDMADIGIILDINNIYVSSFNHGFDAKQYIASIPADRIGYIHLAGYSEKKGYLLDTHDKPVQSPVWQLYEYGCRQLGQLPTMIEWDTNIPEFSELELQINRARTIASKVEHELPAATG